MTRLLKAYDGVARGPIIETTGILNQAGNTSVRMNPAWTWRTLLGGTDPPGVCVHAEGSTSLPRNKMLPDRTLRIRKMNG